MFKPFSAFYFLKQNKGKTILLMLLIMVIALCWLAGVYVVNAENQFMGLKEHLKDSAIVWKSEFHNTEEYQKFIDDIDMNEVTDVIPTSFQSIFVKTMFGNLMNTEFITFQSNEDLSKFSKIVECIPDDLVLDDGEVALSQILANNIKVGQGDVLSKDEKEKDNPRWKTRDDFFVKKVFKEKNTYDYIACMVTEKYISDTSVIITRKDTGNLEADRQNFARYVSQLTKTYNLEFQTYQNCEDYSKNEFEFFYMIYYVIIAVVAIVLAITIGTAVVAVYDKRKYEFSVYRAIGMSKREICGKIIKELLLINLFGLIGAFFLSMFAIFMLNNLFLYSIGMVMKYFYVGSIISTLICDVAIILPTLILRTSKIKKYDITQY